MLKRGPSSIYIFAVNLIKGQQRVLPQHCIQRSLSTNSAINKGLRKATHSRSRLDPPARLGGLTRRSDNGNVGRVSASGNRSFKQTDRSAQNEDAPRGRTRRNITLNQRNDLRTQGDDNTQFDRQSSYGGPRRMEQRASRAAVSSQNNSDRQSSYGGPRRMQQRPSRAVVSSQNNSARTKSRNASPTRAERRAALFGHKENPPAGFKGLPSKPSHQPHWTQGRQEDRRARLPLGHSRNRERTDFRDVGESSKARDEPRGADIRVRSEDSNRSKERSSSLSDERPLRKSSAPLSIPYTTPASEFLYGHSVVTMALKSSRRTFYKLYLYDGDMAEVRGQDKQVRKLALAANLEVTRVGNDWIKLMDKMSGGRPHNGYILEASPLPRSPVTGLRRVSEPRSASRSTFDIIPDHQSREEEAVNGTSTTVSYGTGHPRYPFLLLLDSIRDPGNMGAIIRSAHFLGVDGILICTRNSAALTPVALKAAAGAAETLPLYSVSQPASFMDECQDNGWKFYAAVSPSSADSGRASGRPYYSTTELGDPTQEHPCVLILGSEGEGLRWNIQKKADYMLGIEAQREQRELDSLNVSVASALLCDAFLRPQMMGGKRKGRQEPVDAFEEDDMGQDVDIASTGQGRRNRVAAADDGRLF